MNKDPATEIEEMTNGAFPEEVRVTVFVAVCPTTTDPNGTLVLLSENEGFPTFSWIAKLFVEPFAVPVMLTVWALLTAVIAAEKLADNAPAGMMIDDGRETAALLLLSAIVTPPLGAAALRLTEHALASAPMTVASLHVRPLNAGATPSPLTLIVEDPCVELLEIVTVPLNELTWSA